MFWKKKMATKSKKKLYQQLREVLAQQLNEKQAKLTEQKAFQEELEKKVMERIDVTVQTKVDKMEMTNEQQKVVTEKAIFERIGELEGQQKHQKQQVDSVTKASVERFSQLQNEQKKILEKISVLEQEAKQKRKVLLKFQENCWDAFACHKDIEIIGDKSLIVHYNGNDCGIFKIYSKINFSSKDWRSVFAKYPIVLNKDLSDFFYFEISVLKKECFLIFGFAVKQQNKLDETIRTRKGTYAYESDGDIWINGEEKGTNAKYSYGEGDTVGIGVNSATGQIFFTKNGLRLDNSGFLIYPSFADGFLYPFVTLLYTGDKIEANFGPNFKFGLETLKEELIIH